MANEQTPTQTSLASLFDTFVRDYQEKHGDYPKVEHDKLWPSEVELDKVNDGELTRWKPHFLAKPLSFANVEKALEIELHPSVKEFFALAYSENIDAKCEHGQLSLLFAWNFEDFERLQQNIIGHVMMKRRLRQPISIFFAITDEEDINLVVNNEDGSVWIEPVGLTGTKKLANSLPEFIDGLTVTV
ncbi:SecY-interacting protein [Thalassotalea mangrovi]|uniref:SecY-interacting protein n=1 Tax=Thalassotalea mangrovi TaxID=2572245 RepID=A0A4U1B1W7_9GAMM|nr:SecY-interacting protein [Thalassotalea mangrovi]TKB43524.1 SecY-interacting protein [Thalassotalea mangrovi]